MYGQHGRQEYDNTLSKEEATMMADKTTFSPHSNVHVALLNWIVKDSCSLMVSVMDLQQK